MAKYEFPVSRADDISAIQQHLQSGKKLFGMTLHDYGLVNRSYIDYYCLKGTDDADWCLIFRIQELQRTRTNGQISIKRIINFEFYGDEEEFEKSFALAMLSV